MARRDEIKTRYKNYAKVFLDFVNAPSTDEAGSKFIPNLQVAFNFPDAVPSSITGEDIPDEFNRFDSITEFLLNLSEKEKELMVLIIEEQDIFGGIREIISPFDITEEYNSKERTLSIAEIRYEQFAKNDFVPEIDSVTDFNIDSRENYHKIIAWDGEKERGELCDRFFNMCNRLMDIGAKINRLCDSRDDEMFQKMEDMANIYGRVLKEHNYIKNVQAKISKFLDYMIMRSTMNIFKSEDSLRCFLNAYNSISRPETYHDIEENTFPTLPIFPAPFYLNRFDTMPGEIPPGYQILDEYYLWPLAYCLIEYFKDERYVGYIKKCSECKIYFERKTRRVEKTENYFCSDKCRMIFNNRLNIQSGKHAEYKREGRKQGKYQ